MLSFAVSGMLEVGRAVYRDLNALVGHLGLFGTKSVQALFIFFRMCLFIISFLSLWLRWVFAAAWAFL